MEKLSRTLQQRVYYFQNGADKDGFEICTRQHLQLAFAAVEESVRYELGNDADEYLDKEVMPYVKSIANKFEG